MKPHLILLFAVVMGMGCASQRIRKVNALKIRDCKNPWVVDISPDEKRVLVICDPDGRLIELDVP